MVDLSVNLRFFETTAGLEYFSVYIPTIYLGNICLRTLRSGGVYSVTRVCHIG